MNRFTNILLCILLLNMGIAQMNTDQSPTFSLNAMLLNEATPLILEGLHLSANTDYNLILTNPEGEVILEEQVSSDAEGNISFMSLLAEEGFWTLAIRGEDARAIFEVEINNARAARAARTNATASNSETTANSEAELAESATSDSETASDIALQADQPSATGLSLDNAATDESTASEDVSTTEDANVAESEAGPLEDAISTAQDGVETRTETVTDALQNAADASTTALNDVMEEAAETQEALTTEESTDPTETERLSEDVVAEAETAAQENTVDAEGRTEASAVETNEETQSSGTADEAATTNTTPPAQEALVINAGDAAAIINNSTDFAELAGLARSLVASGDKDTANQAMQRSLEEFAAQGYDPRLLRSLEQHEAYNFPLRPLQEAIETGNRADADFWANWLKYFVAADVSQVGETIRDYASLVSKEDGRASRAVVREWRDIADTGRRTTLSGVLDSIFSAAGRTGLYGVFSLVAAVIGLHLTLLFKYWVPQSLFLRRQKEQGKKTSLFARLLVIRYYSSFEKLVIVLMFASAILLAGLATWTQQRRTVLTVENGTFASADIQAAISRTTLIGEKGNFLRGYAAHVVGDNTLAKREYEAASNLAVALNNLAIVSSNDSFYEQALALAPNLPEAQFNTGNGENLFPFQRDFLANQAVLAVPSDEVIQAAVAGSWQAEVVKTFRNPWTEFAVLDPWSSLLNNRIPQFSVWLWYLVLSIIMVWVTVHVLWLFVPRPRLARNAPRNPLYEVLALLIPGAGAADEMWGLLLLVPWAIVGIDTLADIFNWGFGIGMIRRWDYVALSILYGINLIAVVVEFFSYRNRMKKLKLDNPDLAREFRLIK